jgi:hypothetical protein
VHRTSTIYWQRLENHVHINAAIGSKNRSCDSRLSLGINFGLRRDPTAIANP